MMRCKLEVRNCDDLFVFNELTDCADYSIVYVIERFLDKWKDSVHPDGTHEVQKILYTDIKYVADYDFSICDKNCLFELKVYDLYTLYRKENQYDMKALYIYFKNYVTLSHTIDSLGYPSILLKKNRLT